MGTGQVTPDFKASFESKPDLGLVLDPELYATNKKLRIANEELAKKREEQEYLYHKLEKLLNLKNQFFANVSHELRTPLSLIIGPVEKILAQQSLPLQTRMDLETVERNARILLRQVNDLLDVAKQEAGKMELTYEEIDLAKLLRLTAENFDSLARERSIMFRIDCPEVLLAQVDPEKMQRVVLNLLSNAFKFTPRHGSIICDMRIIRENVQLSVTDSGPGIPEELRESIFDRFYQGHQNGHRQYGGSGLGLTIVKDFIEIQRGKVYVDEPQGGGARFVVTIPILAQGKTVKFAKSPFAQQNYMKVALMELQPPTPLPLPDKFDPAKATILIVEDNVEMNNFIISLLICDFNIISANNGMEGFEKALLHKPDLILSDIMMPFLNGDHMVHEIRKHEELKDIPIILLTAKADDDLRIKLLREGAQDYVRKPFSQEELRARIYNLVYLKKAKDEIKKKVTELTLANEELDAFSRSVSHDLRNPVNAIMGFSSVLLKHTHFDLTEKDYLNEIHHSAKKMDHLIHDLLVLSQATRRDIRHERINLSALIHIITSTLRRQHPKRIVDVKIQENIFINGDSHLLQIAFENLMNNAWKYTSKCAGASIEFARLDEKTYYVKDNGVGFPINKINKLFTPFSRLHAETEFPGTGIGLTTVKRIIDRHGGRVWAENNAEQGATFYVTLP